MATLLGSITWASRRRLDIDTLWMSFGFSFLFVCIGGVRSGGSESKPRGAAVGFDFTLVGSIPTLSCAGR